MRTLANSDEEVSAHRQTYADHDGPHLSRIGFLRIMRTKPASYKGACDHHRALRPQYGAGHDKREHCRGVNSNGQQRPDLGFRERVQHGERGAYDHLFGARGARDDESLGDSILGLVPATHAPHRGQR